MIVCLNDNTFSPSDWADEKKIRQFLSLCKRMNISKTSVFADKVSDIRNAVRHNGMINEVRNKLLSLVSRPYIKTIARNTPLSNERCNSHHYSIVSADGNTMLSGREFAWAYLNGGMLVGLEGSSYGDLFEYQVYRCRDGWRPRQQFASYMASAEKHIEKPVLKRWLYAYKSRDNIECARNHNFVQFPAEHVKHFPHKGISEKEWLDSTKSGAAKFIPAIKKDSLAYAYLVASLIRAAFEHQAYCDSEQNTFSVDVGRPVGAADGKKTSALIMYVTNGTDVHIRPYEKTAKVRIPEIGERLRQYLRS